MSRIVVQSERICADCICMSAAETELLEENRALQRVLAERDERISERDEKIAALEQQVARIAELEQEIEALERELRGAARDRATLEARLKELLARRRALGTLDAPGQLGLFAGEAPVPTPPCAKEAPDGETSTDEIRPRHRRTNAPRKIAYAALPREHLQHELPESERICPVTGKALVAIGEKESEELEYRPAKLVVLVHHRAVYGLSEADRKERTIEPLVAPAPSRPIENGLAGAGLLAWILVQKYCNHLPLYRQQAIFEREGLALPRQTMCDWVLACARLLGPIQAALKKKILTSGVFQLDDTPIECQAGKGAANFKAHLWTYASPLVKGVVFDFAPDWGHEHVAAFLGDEIAGYFVGDGYAGYGTLAKQNPALIEAGCWAHVLRKFRDALKESPVEALAMVRKIGKLFDVEKAALDAKLEPEAVRALRLERCPPVLAEIQSELESMRGSSSDQGPLAKALTYLANQWPTLVRFLEDGRVPIHNNSCENAIRPVAVGRRNWLFAGSESGGHAAATIYSLIESCRRVGVDPFLYLRDVLVRVGTHPAARVDDLMPEYWKKLFGSKIAR
jgi:transposase